MSNQPRSKVNLHAHEQTASGDSATSIRGMANEYARQGFDLVGFVGHDAQPDIPDDLPVEAMAGVEREVRTEPTRLHVVEYPDHDLRILAHPSLTWRDDTASKAAEAARELDVDAIELYTRGRKQLPEPSVDEFPRAASDDAHNTAGVGASFMETDTPAEPDAVADAVRDGRVVLKNPGMSLGERMKHRLHQTIALGRHYTVGGDTPKIEE